MFLLPLSAFRELQRQPIYRKISIANQNERFLLLLPATVTIGSAD